MVPHVANRIDAAVARVSAHSVDAGFVGGTFVVLAASWWCWQENGVAFAVIIGHPTFPTSARHGSHWCRVDHAAAGSGMAGRNAGAGVDALLSDASQLTGTI